LIYPFQGDHFEEVRLEAVELIEKNVKDFDGLKIFTLFDESNVAKDIVQTKKASKFYNLHLLEDPSLSKKDTEKKSKSLAQILGKNNSNTDVKLQQVLDTYNYQNRKMVYKCLDKLPLGQNIPSNFNLNDNFNNLEILLEKNKLQNKKTLFYSSDGGFFRVIEGAYFGCQVFEGGFPFEITKQKRALMIDLKRWALLSLSITPRVVSDKPEDLVTYITDFIKNKKSESNADLFSEFMKTSEQKEEDNPIGLTKRSDAEFIKEKSSGTPKLSEILKLLNTQDQSYKIKNECNLLITLFINF
jgi:hypothetical protein